jgi:hypothetical protein
MYRILELVSEDVVLEPRLLQVGQVEGVRVEQVHVVVVEHELLGPILI